MMPHRAILVRAAASLLATLATSAALAQAPAHAGAAAGRSKLPPPAAWVARLQRDLTTLHFYAGPVTGVFGPLTRAAVINFQKAQRLAADGSWGPESQAALTKLLANRASNPSSSTLPPPAVWVARLQRDLSMLHFYSGPITGVFGPLTRAAVLSFQRAERLVPDGRWGPQSQAMLTRRLHGKR
jgi:peptidoglycan hydrolase-like protein with peptidoglycan-binding domain